MGSSVRQEYPRGWFTLPLLWSQLGSLACQAGLGFGLGCLSLGLGMLPATAEVSGVPAGAPSLGTVINGVPDGSCSSGPCEVSGGTGAGPNLFHRFGNFDTRGGITGVSIQSGGYQNVIVGVMSALGTTIDQPVSLSSPGNLFWLSPGGIQIRGAGGFPNVQNLQLSSATGMRISGGVFDALGTSSSQAALLTGDPVLGNASLLSDPAALLQQGLTNNGDITLANGLLTVQQSLLLDSQGGNVLLDAMQVQAPVISMAGHLITQAGGLLLTPSADPGVARFSIGGPAVLGGAVSVGSMETTVSSPVTIANGGSLELYGAFSPSSILGGLTLQPVDPQQPTSGPVFTIQSGATALVSGFRHYGGTLAGAGALLLSGSENIWTDGIWGGGGSTLVTGQSTLVLSAPNLPVNLDGRSIEVKAGALLTMRSYANVIGGLNAIVVDSGGVLSFERASWTSIYEPTDTGFFADSGQLNIVTQGALNVAAGVHVEFYSYGPNAHIVWDGAGPVQIASGSVLRLYGDLYSPNFALQGAVANLSGSINIGPGATLASTNSNLNYVANLGNLFAFDGSLVVNGGFTSFDFGSISGGADPWIGAIEIIDGTVDLAVAPNSAAVGMSGSPSGGVTVGRFLQTGGLLTVSSDLRLADDGGLNGAPTLETGFTAASDKALPTQAEPDARDPSRSLASLPVSSDSATPASMLAVIQPLSAEQARLSYQVAEARASKDTAFRLGLMSSGFPAPPTIEQVQVLLQGIQMLMRNP